MVDGVVVIVRRIQDSVSSRRVRPGISVLTLLIVAFLAVAAPLGAIAQDGTPPAEPAITQEGGEGNLSQDPVSEQPVIEQPVIEEPIVEEPVIEEPVVEQPAPVDPNQTAPEGQLPVDGQDQLQQPEEALVQEPQLAPAMAPASLTVQPQAIEPAAEGGSCRVLTPETDSSGAAVLDVNEVAAFECTAVDAQGKSSPVKINTTSASVTAGWAFNDLGPTDAFTNTFTDEEAYAKGVFQIYMRPVDFQTAARQATLTFQVTNPGGAKLIFTAVLNAKLRAPSPSISCAAVGSANTYDCTVNPDTSMNNTAAASATVSIGVQSGAAWSVFVNGGAVNLATGYNPGVAAGNTTFRISFALQGCNAQAVSGTATLTVAYTYVAGHQGTATTTVNFAASAGDTSLPSVSVGNVAFAPVIWNGAGYPTVQQTAYFTVGNPGGQCTGAWTIQASATSLTSDVGEIPASAMTYQGMTNAPMSITQQNVGASIGGTTTIASGTGALTTGPAWGMTLQLAPPSSSPLGSYFGTITVGVAASSG